MTTTTRPRERLAPLLPAAAVVAAAGGIGLLAERGWAVWLLTLAAFLSGVQGLRTD